MGEWGDDLPTNTLFRRGGNRRHPHENKGLRGIPPFDRASAMAQQIAT